MQLTPEGFGTHLDDVLEKFGTRQPNTDFEAQAVLEAIRADKGHLDADFLRDLGRMDAKNRNKVLRLNTKNKDTEATFTRSISKGLYSSRYRFLYEIIQNADDASYRNVKQPFLHFKVNSETFTIETNEDGFTLDNVIAICATGKSSKKHDALVQCTGEKGFGFKSVFTIAHEVHIQSGPWCFRFKHRQGEDGLGMVTPLDAKPNELPPKVNTRITLHLTKTTFEDYAQLLDAIKDMPETTLLFLRQLPKLHIEITHWDGETELVRIKKITSADDDTIKIVKSQEINCKRKALESIYHVFTHEVNDMPEEDTRQGRSTTSIALAFPTDSIYGRPQLSKMGQHLFAYLPLQRLPQLHFLIQADFVTSANRESVLDCAWNAAICDGVITAFTSAIQTFATDGHPLRHRWLDYLPVDPMEKPWDLLFEKITDKLKTVPVLETWEQRQFRKPSKLRQLPEHFLFRGDPLLKDLSKEIYLAPEYYGFGSRILRKLGVELLDWKKIMPRLQQDCASPESNIKTKKRNSAWWEAFAELGMTLLEGEDEEMQDRFKRTPIICLSNANQWTGAPGISPGGCQDIYFPTSDNCPIPNDIGLFLVDKNAAANFKVREFYAALGVEDCPKEKIFDAIQNKQITSGETVDLAAHLNYLFHHHDEPETLVWLRVPTDQGVKCCSEQLYFSSEAEYDLDQLLTPSTRRQKDLKCSFIPTDFMEMHSNRKSVLRIRDRTWLEWLTAATNARYYPELRRRVQGKYHLSRDLKKVLDYNPSKFLPTLKAHWNDYQRTVSSVREQISRCEVPCEDGMSHPLHATYLPTKRIRSSLGKLGIEGFGIAILDLPELDEEQHREWRFLEEEFGVCSEPNLEFYKRALEELVEIGDVPLSSAETVYRSMAHLATTKDHEDLWDFFSEGTYVYADDEWISSADCVWKGPDFLTHLTVLETMYSEDEDECLKKFFKVILDLKDATAETILSELEMMSNGELDEWDDCVPLEAYEYLDAHCEDKVTLTELRSSFESKSLVYDGSKHWHSLATCYWHSPSPLDGYVDLRKAYPDLEEFFTRKLGVKEVNSEMLLREIQKIASQRSPDIDALRSLLMNTGRVLTEEDIDTETARALKDLRKTKFLPKRTTGGKLVLVGISDRFSIRDHVRYGEAFDKHDILLDFNVHETQIMHGLFKSLGLESRYLSTAVVEQSSISDQGAYNNSKSTRLQERAYALYCCAAKHKSRKALHGDNALFDQLSKLGIYTTNNIATDLVLNIQNDEITVKSKRTTLYNETVDGKLRIYVPEDVEQRRISWRSQLPKLLAAISGCDVSASDDISNIISCKRDDLDDILSERDITEVSWIKDPGLDMGHSSEDEDFDLSDQSDSDSDSNSSRTRTDRSSTSSGSSSGSIVRASSSMAQIPVSISISRCGSSEPIVPVEAQKESEIRRENYCNLLGQFIDIARKDRSCDRISFNSDATFGSYDTDGDAKFRRIGAAGEAYVYETFAFLGFPGFSFENWRSTIRTEVCDHEEYASLRQWRGKETTDIVYTDRTGKMSRYLRRSCIAGFPDEIAADHDHDLFPVKYYLEVKSTPGDLETQFYMSNSQHDRMEEMARRLEAGQFKVYVLIRVHNLVNANVNFEIFVNPWTLTGTHLAFKARTWSVKAKVDF